MQSKLFSLTTGIALLTLSVSSVSAAVVEYTSASAFNAAVPGTAAYDFEGIIPAGTFSAVSPTTVGGVTFDAAPANNIAFIIGNGLNGPSTYGGAAFFSGQTTDLLYTSDVNATLSGTTAIGFFYGPGDDGEGAINVTLNTGDSFNLAIPALFGTTNFVGFTSDTPITGIAFTEQGYGMNVTGFQVATVPAPAAAWLFGTGLLGMAGVARRKTA